MDVVPGHYNTMWFRPTKAGPLSFLLLAVLRYKSRHHGRLGHRHGAGRICCLARRKYRDGRSRGLGAKLYNDLACKRAIADARAWASYNGLYARKLSLRRLNGNRR